MMSSNNSNRTRRTRGLLGVLKKTPFDVLKKLRVGVRVNVSAQVPPGPIERSIDDLESIRLLVNYRKDGQHRQRSLFDRNDIVINQDEPDDTETSILTSRSESKSPKSCRKRNNGSNSPRKRSNSPRRSTCPEKRSPQREKSTDRTGRSSRSSNRVRDRRSRSEERHRERSSDRYKDRNRSGYRKSSFSPLRPGEYVPFHPDLKKRSALKEDNDKTRYMETRRSQRRSRSRSPRRRSRSRSPRRRSRSRSPRRRSRRRSPRRRSRSRSPRRRSRSRSSRRRSRSRSSRRRSRSRSSRRRRSSSRSPRRRSRSRSPRRRTRSRSPRHKGILDAEFWFPGPMRPGFSVMPNFYPPVYLPRGVPLGPIMPPPRYPMMYAPIRPRIIYNNRKIPKSVIQSVVGGEGPEKAVVSAGESEVVQRNLADPGTKDGGA